MLIVADTSPLNYLVRIGAIDVLPSLYKSIVIPTVVFNELKSPANDSEVVTWAASAPAWLVIRDPSVVDQALPIDPGEAAAIALAQELNADRLLIDDRDGRMVAESLGIQVAGTLAVLRDAALEGLVDLTRAFESLQKTTFRASPALYEAILQDFERRDSTEH